jgi:hypothetical protein
LCKTLYITVYNLCIKFEITLIQALHINSTQQNSLLIHNPTQAINLESLVLKTLCRAQWFDHLNAIVLFLHMRASQ